jgi:hypothetical protein
VGNVRHLHGDGNATGTPHHDLGGYSYSAFGKLLRGSDPGALSGGVPLFGWQGKRVLSAQQPNLYDSRARVWSADLGAFLQPDEYVFLTRTGTLWSWPGQNPFRYRDHSGRGPPEDVAGAVLDALAAAADSGAVVATGQGVAETPLGAASDAALNGLELFADHVKGLAQAEFADQDASANAIARAEARARAACDKLPQPPELPKLDATGKVHGPLPGAGDLNRYSPEELEQLSEELQQSVQERIQQTNEMDPDKAHGE